MISIDEQVYAYLRRLGYSVTRHGFGFQRVHEEAQQILEEEFRIWLQEKIARKEREAADRIAQGIPPEESAARIVTKAAEEPLAPVAKNPPIRVVPQQHAQEYAQILAEIPQPRLFSSKETFEPMWDVYKPSARFKKKQPGSPDFRLIVRSYKDPALTVVEYDALGRHLEQLEDGKTVPVKMAIVESGLISFLGIYI